MAGFPSCIAASNSGNPAGFILSLSAGTQYHLVAFNDSFDQEQSLGYRLENIGAGEVIFGIVPLFVDGFEDAPVMVAAGAIETVPPGPSGR